MKKHYSHNTKQQSFTVLIAELLICIVNFHMHCTFAVWDERGWMNLLSCRWNVLLPRPRYGDGVLFSIDFLDYLFLCKQDCENGWTDLHEIFMEGVEWPWDGLIQFWVIFKKTRHAAMLILCQQSAFVNSTRNQLFWKFWQSCAAI